MQSLLKRPPTESPLDRLERESNDDFHLLSEIGPTQFGTDHLMELRTEVEDRLVLFQRRMRLAITLGAVAAAWAFLGFVALWLRHVWLALCGLGLSALCFVGFLGLVLLLKRRYESKGELDYAKRQIEDELRRRTAQRRMR